jgi:hypothetical protein
MQYDISLILDASWRSPRAGKWRFDLRSYGLNARRTAKELGMVVRDRVAYLTDSSCDAAERILEARGIA